jgi:hypothetical protein
MRSVAGGSAYVLTVTGQSTEVQGLVVTPETEVFGVVPVGSTSGVATIALTNLLSPAVNTSVQSVAVSGDFALVANASGGQQVVMCRLSSHRRWPESATGR